MSVPKKKMQIVQGETFRKVLYWYHGNDAVFAITAATLGYPTILTAVGHGMPLTSAVPVTLLGRNTWLNTKSVDPSDRIYATAINADQFTVPIDSTDEAAYTSGNYVIYTPPVNLTGWTGRMQIRPTVKSTDILIELTTENGGMSLGADGAVNLVILDVNTSALEFVTAVGDIELVSPSTGDVTRLATITFTLSDEVTR